MLLLLLAPGCLPDDFRVPTVEPLTAEELAEPIPLPRPPHCPARTQLVQAADVSTCMDRFPMPGFDAVPLSVDRFEDAVALCAQDGMRLCTEREWERGCRGRAGHRYPYGDLYQSARCQTETAQPRSAGMRLDCRSDFGIYDTSGSVAEWTAEGLLKGGDARGGAFETRCGARVNPAIDEMTAFRGVRCCLDADPAPDGTGGVQ